MTDCCHGKCYRNFESHSDYMKHRKRIKKKPPPPDNFFLAAWWHCRWEANWIERFVVLVPTVVSIALVIYSIIVPA